MRVHLAIARTRLLDKQWGRKHHKRCTKMNNHQITPLLLQQTTENFWTCGLRVCLILGAELEAAPLSGLKASWALFWILRVKELFSPKFPRVFFFRSYTSKEIHSLIKPHNYITVLIFFSLKKELLKNRGTALLIIGTKFRNSDSANIFQELDLLRFIDMPKYLWRIWVIDFPKST